MRKDTTLDKLLNDAFATFYEEPREEGFMWPSDESSIVMAFEAFMEG